MTKNIKTWIFLKSSGIDILVYYNIKHRSHCRLISKDGVKSFTVGVCEKKETMRNEVVILHHLLLILNSLPSLAMWMEKALVVTSPV